MNPRQFIDASHASGSLSRGLRFPNSVHWKPEDQKIKRIRPRVVFRVPIEAKNWKLLKFETDSVSVLGSKSLRLIRNKIDRLANRQPDEDGFVNAPTTDARTEIMKLLLGAYQSLVAEVPVPIVAPDGSGGLKLDWRRSSCREVRLYAPADASRTSYLYLRLNADSQFIDTPSSNDLRGYLEML